MGRRRVKKPKYVITDYDRLGNERIYFRVAGKQKVRLRGPLFSDDFFDDYAKAKKGELKPREIRVSRNKTPPAGTFARLCVDYYQSADYRRLNPDTRYRRRLVLDPLREKYGDFPAGKMEAKHIRRMKDARAEKPHSANALIKALRQLFKYGVEYGYVKSNPAREVSTLRGSVDGYHTWTPEEVSQYEAHFARGTQQRLAFDLMLYTGVRRSDAVLLGRQHIKEDCLVFTPEKGKDRKPRRLTIPIHPNLAASICATQTGDMTMLVTKFMRPWGSRASFGNRFKAWCAEAGLKRCSAHGLRKVAALRLIEAGCTAAQAAAITGHDSLQILERYARERDRAKLADDAMRILITAENKASTVPLDNTVPNHGTIEPPNTLKGNEVWKRLAPRAGLEPATS